MGIFVVFEGLDGAGKTHTINQLKKLETQYSFFFSREPGGTLFGEQIRNLLFEHKELSATTQALLFAAARIEHIKAIKTQLVANKIVISDRFVDSSMLYQSYNCQLAADFIRTINQEAYQFVPNITFYFVIDQNIYQERLNLKQQSNDFNHLDVQFSANAKMLNLYNKFLNDLSQQHMIFQSDEPIK